MSTAREQSLAAVMVGAVMFVACLFSLMGSSGPQANGKQLFDKRCGGCHSLDRDKEGPRLKGVFGRKAASLDTFEYSDALKKSGVVWSDATLDKWLVDPEKVAPDNNMQFHLENAAERRAIIAYLKENSGR